MGRCLPRNQWISWTGDGHPVANEKEIKGGSYYCEFADRFVAIWEDGFGVGWTAAEDEAARQVDGESDTDDVVTELLEMFGRLLEYWDQGAPVHPGSLIVDEVKELVAWYAKSEVGE